ncbi:formate dehydrogenase subunit gamma [Parasulfitobacter algicola]|uniref:Formate dehydrogenase subunit gamma n=1 Tax=Parasulfitobacter algicola TaxID=2614809 RepID=A0ABX2IRQ1_9RHOB|nr:formate dehydrogenase subunit gamma [Sulfitobacter algicola]NSX55574.1 formate dehydrogenase subunit gamma [Sulfitobacter algicola]
MFRALIALLLTITFVSTAPAQETEAPAPVDRSVTGGAPTLEDILARQRGETVDDSYRRNLTGDTDSAAGMANQLGTLGGASDSEVYRALRFGTADVTVSSRGPAAEVLIQDGGMRWLLFREGPLLTYGGYLLLATLILLTIFYVLRGRIRIDGPKTGRTITRFKAVERFGHWLLAGSFILLGITGLVSLFGRVAIIPLLGHEAFATFAMASKWIHNNVAWAFMLGLVMVFVMWVLDNIPNKTDLKWLAVGGGLFSKDVHPPAKKFNAGQKMIFWSVVVLGVSISLSGLSLLFPFEMPMFAKTFAILNDTGLPQLLGFGTLPEVMAPHEEMQYAQAWHSIVAFIFMAIIFAHIYIGSVGMEGAFDAMGSGEVEEQWAKEHHGLWVEEVKAKEQEKISGSATPAE